MAMKPPIAVPTSTVARNALVAVAIVAVGGAVYWLADILTPLAMAIFLLIMIDGLKRFIEERTPVPSHLAGAAALIVVILGFFASIAIIANGALNFFDDATGVTSRMGPRLDQVIGDVAALFGVQTPPTASELITQLDIRGYLTAFALQAQG
ncbi:MAG: AI-2E family transporter, partial [Alphaproteobacteria bacterium]